MHLLKKTIVYPSKPPEVPYSPRILVQVHALHYKCVPLNASPSVGQVTRKHCCSKIPQFRHSPFETHQSSRPQSEPSYWIISPAGCQSPSEKPSSSPQKSPGIILFQWTSTHPNKGGSCMTPLSENGHASGYCKKSIQSQKNICTRLRSF